MVVGIIGVLAAIAIPAYQNYTKKAKIGVAESMLQTMKRSIQIQKSVGEIPSAANLWASVVSDDKDNFGNTYTFKSGTDIWCIGVVAKAGNDYSDIGFLTGATPVAEEFQACINQNSVVHHNGESDSKATRGTCIADGVCKDNS